jgi:Zn-dependent peptidase ImmA (M78 family)
MLKDLLKASQLDPVFCAGLVRVAPDQFNEWVTENRLPEFVLPELSSILGVTQDTLKAKAQNGPQAEKEIAPAIWFKLRAERLTGADREMIGFVRKLGLYLEHMQALGGSKDNAYGPLFASIRENVDVSAPPAVQGRTAAQVFRRLSDMQHGQQGIGEWIRPYLRRVGILVLECPLAKSEVEGCCFLVGGDGSARPCLFANSHKADWFRRNEILGHELCHSIFDLTTEPVSIDYFGAVTTDISELRAQAFTQEFLVPKTVLVHFANKFGLKWNDLSPEDLGRLIASVHVGKRAVVDAIYEANLIEKSDRERYLNFTCGPHVREHTDHALTTVEYLRKKSEDSPTWVAGRRNVKIGNRTLRLPFSYAQQVLDCVNSGKISIGKAAEMMMMNRRVFLDRFGQILTLHE